MREKSGEETVDPGDGLAMKVEGVFRKDSKTQGLDRTTLAGRMVAP